jgi:hypothetical protein
MTKHRLDLTSFVLGVATIAIAIAAWSGDLGTSLNNGSWFVPVLILGGLTTTAIALRRAKP